MKELVRMISQKTGLSDEKAKIAVEMAVGYLKGRLPSAMAGPLDAALSGGGSGAQGIGDLTKGLGGLLGKE